MTNKIVEARQRSKDPNQEHLRQHKENWNKATSEVISRIIALKRALNGRGDASYNLPTSNIKNPFPSEIPSFLNQIASDFSKLVGSANSIISEQENYSKSRKKKPNIPSKANIDYDFIKNAGILDNYVLWKTWLSSLFSKDEYKSFRLGMLRLCVELKKMFDDFENKVLILDIEKIPDAVKQYQDVRYGFEKLKDYLNVLESTGKKIKDKAVEEEKEKEEKEEENSEEISKIEKDHNFIMELNIDQKLVYPLRRLLKEYKNIKSNTKKSLIKDRIIDEYEKLLKTIESKISEDYGPVNISSIEEAVEVLRLKSANYDNELIKVSHNIITRFLRRQLVEMSKLNATSPIRLEIDKKINKSKKVLEELISMLKKEINLSVLSEKISELENTLKEMHLPINTLNAFYKKHYFDESNFKGKDRGTKDIIQNILTKKIKKDMEEDF